MYIYRERNFFWREVNAPTNGFWKQQIMPLIEMVMLKNVFKRLGVPIQFSHS